MSKEKIKEMMAERDNIDDQLECLYDVLKSHGVDMKTSLVDTEGFPVAELDILSIRKARHSIICLSNDRKKLTDEIETALIELHQEARTTTSENSGHEPMQQDETESIRRTSNNPFLKVENVVAGSPADNGGLMQDDVVVQCGPVCADNFENLQHLSEVVGQHVGKEIKVTVLRGSRVHKLVVHPGKWSGAGVFGVRFSAIKSE